MKHLKFLREYAYLMSRYYMTFGMKMGDEGDRYFQHGLEWFFSCTRLDKEIDKRSKNNAE